jgi:hypothetical protein
MAKKAVLQIVTANNLLEGHSVFLSPEGWTADHRRARIAVGAEEAAALEVTGRRDEDSNIVVGVYLVDVEIGESGEPEPTHYREKLRVRARPSFWADEPKAAIYAAPVRGYLENAHVSL